MKTRTHVTIIMASMLVFAADAFAQTRVFVKTSMQPVAAIGIAMKADGTSESYESRIAEVTGGVYSVAFDAAGDPTTMVTAVVSSEAGELAFGAVRPITSPDPLQLLLETPECPKPPPPSNPNPEQLGLVLKLVEVRSARRELTQIKVAKILDGPFLEKLQKLERGFGLAGERDLSPTLPSMELLNRLSMLSIALKNYEINKEREIR